MKQNNDELFQPFTFGKGVMVRNRIAMAPMTTWASNDDYTLSDDEERHYKARSQEVGMVITGCTRVMTSGIGFTHEYAAYDDSFLPSLQKLATAAKSGGAPAILQIFHAGNKAIPELVPNGDVVSASAVQTGPMPFVRGEIIPRALRQEEILQIVTAFGAATRRAIEAGFDGVELHGAHGFLLQNFFSPLYNQRTDEWGGTAENRMRFPLAVILEVQRVISEHATRPFILGYRISPEEHQPESYKLKDIYPFIDRLIEADVDYIHVSLVNLLEAKPIGATDETTIIEHILTHIQNRIPVIAAGQIKQPEEAVKAIEMGLSMVAIGQALIINPDWIKLAADGGKIEEALSISKIPELAIPDKLWRVIDATKGWFQLTA